ncbi:MAG: hypothetical protein JSS91_05375 [Bacteroidetes bacterium]|nr:hypothetical protein [Bacteroidota bacterium]
MTRNEMRERAYVFWKGTKTTMTFREFASYCAPVFWFSPDEPELRLAKGRDIRIPTNFPFENSCDSPVVYYQISEIFPRGNAKGKLFQKDYSDINNSKLDISKINAINIDYNHYYRFEAGLGGHNHDTEQSKFKILIKKTVQNDTVYYYFVFLEATGKAHALSWFDNVYTIDTSAFETKLPFNILVEEGKHASCTDINGDGYYTPGYDVNQRKNDAWGVRDVIRTGTLFSSSFQSYMQKIRTPEYRVFPPLPEDSPLRKYYTKDSIYSPDNAVYDLRPMPGREMAKGDKLLYHDIESYSMESWPIVESKQKDIFSWFESEQVIKSIGISYRNDNGTNGLSFTFPLLIVKNVETPIIGGWIVNRIYLQNRDFTDFGYNILLTPSASGFLDTYFSAGLEVNKLTIKDSLNIEKSKIKTDFAMELGFKIRANVNYSPLKFLNVLSDFWGVRIGIKNKGFSSIKSMNYIFEVGAGVW